MKILINLSEILTFLLFFIIFTNLYIGIKTIMLKLFLVINPVKLGEHVSPKVKPVKYSGGMAAKAPTRTAYGLLYFNF